MRYLIPALLVIIIGGLVYVSIREYLPLPENTPAGQSIAPEVQQWPASPGRDKG